MDVCERKLLNQMRKKKEILLTTPAKFTQKSNNNFFLLENFMKDKNMNSKISNDNSKPQLVEKDKEEIVFITKDFSLAPDKSTYFSFTEPILSVKRSSDGGFVFDRHYTNFKAGDKLFIWLTVNRAGNEHVVAHIQTKNNKNYSFGFGYWGEFEDSYLRDHPFSVKQLERQQVKDDIERKPGALYTPDYLFELRLNQQVDKPQNTFIKLIASAVLTNTNIQSLNSRFDLLTNVDTDLIVLNLIQVIKAKPIYYMANIIKFDDIQYCSWSTERGETNCAGFIERIFSDDIHCPGNPQKHYNPDPDTCVQISPLNSCDDFSDDYIIEDQSFKRRNDSSFSLQEQNSPSEDRQSKYLRNTSFNGNGNENLVIPSLVTPGLVTPSLVTPVTVRRTRTLARQSASKVGTMQPTTRMRTRSMLQFISKVTSPKRRKSSATKKKISKRKSPSYKTKSSKKSQSLLRKKIV